MGIDDHRSLPVGMILHEKSQLLSLKKQKKQKPSLVYKMADIVIEQFLMCCYFEKKEIAIPFPGFHIFNHQNAEHFSPLASQGDNCYVG